MSKPKPQQQPQVVEDLVTAAGFVKADVVDARVMSPNTYDRVVGGEPGANTQTLEDLADFVDAPHEVMYACWARTRARYRAAAGSAA